MDFLKSTPKQKHSKQSLSLETFRFLYPIFKEEVYRRRYVMGQIARLGTLFYLISSVFVVFIASEVKMTAISRGSLIGGALITLLLMVFQLIQEKSRHEQAKLQLITLENGLKFFDSGEHFENQPLYPDQWKKRPKQDKGLLVSLICLCGAALLFILILLSV